LGKRSSSGGLSNRVFEPGPSAVQKGEAYHCFLRPEIGSGRGDLSAARKRRCGEGGRFKSRLLLHLLHSAQERRRLTSHPELAPSQQVHHLSQVQDGDQCINFGTHFTGRLAGQLGSQGCLFPCSNLASSSTFPKVSFPGAKLPVQGPSIRSYHCPESLYKDSGPVGLSDSSAGNSILTLFGRLPVSGSISGDSFSPRPTGQSYPSGRRVSDQSNQISSGSDSGSRISWYEAANGSGLGPAFSGASSSSVQVSAKVSTQQVCHSQTFSTSFGLDGGLSSHGAERQTFDASSSNVPVESVESPLSETVSQGIGHLQASIFSQALEESQVTVPRGFAGPQSSLCHGYHRRIYQGVGRPLQRTQGARSLEPKTESVTHKLFRDDGGPVLLQSFPESLDREVSALTDRQYYGPSICQQGGRHQIPWSLLPGLEAPELVSLQWDCRDSSSCGRNRQHLSRFPVKALRVSNRVGARQGSGSAIVYPVGSSASRSIRNESQLSCSNILQLASRSDGLLDRRSVHAMEVGLRVRFPSHSIDTEGDSQGQQGERRAYSHRSQLAQPRVVPAIAQNAGRPSTSASNLSGASDSAAGHSVAPKPGRLVPGSLEDKRQFLVAQGLSPEVAQTIIAARAPGTYARYESSWKHFSTWCGRRRFNPFDTSVSQILDYLQHCMVKLGLSHSTIRNRVFAIALYHRRFPLESLSRHQWIKAFIKGASRICPAQRNILPVWDLQLVLEALRGPPFEPLVGDLKWLTLKVAFLLAITTAKRIGELQALSVDHQYYHSSPAGIRLKLNKAFVPKVNSDKNRDLETFLVPFCPRSQSGNSRSTLYTLCPCRAISVYKEVTKHFRKTDQFFVAFGGAKKGQAVSKMTIARWIRCCIQLAYKSQRQPLPTGLKAHQTRSVAATWAQFNGTSLLDICKTATWSDGCTFARHYQLNLAGHSATAKFANSVLQTVLNR